MKSSPRPRHKPPMVLTPVMSSVPLPPFSSQARDKNRDEASPTLCVRSPAALRRPPSPARVFTRLPMPSLNLPTPLLPLSIVLQVALPPSRRLPVDLCRLPLPPLLLPAVQMALLRLTLCLPTIVRSVLPRRLGPCVMNALPRPDLPIPTSSTTTALVSRCRAAAVGASQAVLRHRRLL